MTVSFELSPELETYRHGLRDWSVAVLRPYARAADASHAAPADWPQILSTCPVPLGRHSRDKTATVTVFPDGEPLRGMVQTEAVNYGDTWAQSHISGGIGHVVVKLLGSPAQVERWHDPILADTAKVTALGLSEPQAGSDTGAISTRAIRDGDCWVLNGTKVFCSHGASAEFVVVIAVVDGGDGVRSTEAFVVERGTPGLEIVRKNETKLGLRAWETSQIALVDCAVPVSHRLASVAPSPSNDGRRLNALTALNDNRPNVSAMATSVAEAALDITQPLLHEQRRAFRPDRWTLVERDLDAMRAAIARSRRVGYRAQWLRGAGRSNRSEASMAKAFGPHTAERIVRRCMQLLGPDGTCTDLLLEKWYRDMKILDIFEGTSQIQRRIITRELAKAWFQP
jgi:acyl-CoA dehydrogenase